MNTSAIAHSIILNPYRQLKRQGLTIVWLELIIIVWMIDSLFTNSGEFGVFSTEYGIKLLSLVLALAILFLLYVHIKSLPKEIDTTTLFNPQEFEKPTLLRMLLAIQIIVFLYGAFSTSAWGQLYAINLLSLDNFRNIFNLTVFFALHMVIIMGIAFFIKLSQINKLVNNRETEEAINTKLKKLHIQSAVLCIITLFLLLFLLIPELPTIITDISYFICSAQVRLLIYVTQVILAALLAYILIPMFRRRKLDYTSSLYKWTTIFLAINLYISLEVFEGGVRTLLEFPVVIVSMLLKGIAEAWLLAVAIRISTYSTIKKCILQKVNFKLFTEQIHML
ncbi:MAG: hypothetical protein LBG19_01010 [Prevotellaceae bacterium]|jgi:hypothetical protein|nr:hypothetical protein [Prevotellaceae bacterium]